MCDKNKIPCIICNISFASNGIGMHLKLHGISSIKEYYDKYFKKEGEGFCQICGKSVSFINFYKGYHAFCKTCGFKKTCIEKYGVDNPNKTPEVREKIKETSIQKYNVPCFMNKDEVKSKLKDLYIDKTWVCDNTLKSKKSKLDRYGDENYCNKEKIKETKLNKYGDENYCNKEKIKETKKEKYGDENYCNGAKISEFFKNMTVEEKEKRICKIKETKLRKYGIENYCNAEKISESHKNRSSEEKIETKKKTQKTLLDKYGVVALLQLATNSGYSKVSQEVFWSLYSSLPVHLQEKTYFHELNHEFHVYNSLECCNYLIDFAISSLKLCIEFQGDIFHANPLKYAKTSKPIPKCELTAEEIWNKDKKRFEYLKSKGFVVIEIWESDYYSNKQKIVEEVLKSIVSLNEELILKNKDMY